MRRRDQLYTLTEPWHRVGAGPAIALGDIGPEATIVGLKRWNLDALEQTLYSRSTGSPWGAREEAARHVPSLLRRYRASHAIPAPNCDCGIHVWTRPDPWLETSERGGDIAGLVEAWGAICVHDGVIRAERVRILLLAYPGAHRLHHVTKSTAARLGVDVVSITELLTEARRLQVGFRTNSWEQLLDTHLNFESS